MDLFAKCKELYEKIRYFEYGIPVDGVIKPIPSTEYFVKNYHFLKPEEFEKYKGGICWDYVEYERKFLEINDIDFNQYYLITNTPPNYDTHTFITVKDGDDLIYIEASFKRVEHIIDGVQKFKSLEDIVKLITMNMWECNGNDKRFDEFKYDVCKFKGHPQYGCTCEEYMKWMDDNSDIVIQDVSINPKKVSQEELTVESCNLFQEGLFNFGKKKEPVDVIAKLSETFGELSEAQIDIVSQLNSGIRFTFEIFNKKFYDVLIQAKKIDEFLANESSIIKNAQGISNKESILPIGSLGIIPDMNKVLEFYENFEEGNLSYDDMISHMDKPENGTTRVRVYADRDGKIYSSLSWNGGYTTIAESFEEFINNFSSYTFKLEENSYTVNRRYFTKDGLDVFTDPTSKRRGETIPFKTTYKLDTDDITAVYALQSRFTNPWCRLVFDPTTTGDGEIWDFMVDYESYEEIEKQCNQKGIKEFYTSMKIIEQTFHKPIDRARLKGIYPTKITYVFALNESLDKPFMTVEVESGKVMSVKFNDSTIKEYVDPEEYDEALHDHLEDEDDIYNESWTDFKNGVHPSSNLMFHVSLKNDMDGKTITPQLPSYITDGGKLDDNYQEDTKTKRLCVSPSIEGCLIAILNYKKIREHVGDKFYVYTPEKPFSQYKHKTNKEIVKDKLVFDANITKEAWILEPCKLKLYGIIKLKKINDLKEKPTVEKNIKMNVEKLDYEWIMTPKASGKFNKAIGDSPDEEDDKKEKPIKEYDNILVPNEEFFMEANKNLVKSLKILDYDPKTKTIKCDIPGYDGKPIKRIIFLIDDYISQEKGDGSVGNVAGKKELLEKYRSKTSDPKKLKAIDADIEYLNTRNDDEWVISIPRKILKTRNLQNLITVNHELGHIYCRETTSDDEWKEMQRWQRTRDEYDGIDRTVKNGDHAISTEELYADTYAADKVSAHALQKTDEKTFKKFKQDICGYIKKAKVKQQKLLNRLKSLPNKLTEEEEYEIKKQARDLVIEIRKLHKPGLPDSQQDPKALAMFKEVLKLEEKLDRSAELPFKKNMIETDLYHIGDALDLYASAIKNLNIEHLTHNAYANKKDRIKFESFSVLVPNDEFFMEASKYERRRQKYIDDGVEPSMLTRERTNSLVQYDKKKKADEVAKAHADKEEYGEAEKLNSKSSKILQILKYDPSTKTIDTGIKLKNGKPVRIKLRIASSTSDGTIFKTAMITTLAVEQAIKNPTRYRMPSVSEYIDDAELNVEKHALNERNAGAFNHIYHEIGHLLDYLNKYYPDDIDESSRANIKKINDHVNKHLDKIKSATVDDHDSKSIEYVADTYAVSKTSPHANRKSMDKIYSRHLNEDYGKRKKLNKELNKLSNPSNIEAYNQLMAKHDDLKAKRSAINKELMRLYDKENPTSEDDKRILQLEREQRDYRDKVEKIKDQMFEIQYKPNAVNGKILVAKNKREEEVNGKKLRTEIPGSFKEAYDCLIMDNEEFFGLTE